MNIISTVTIDEWEKDRESFILIDVRSPKEYEEFHIPGAINLPIFSNDERAKVGTIYKQKGQDEAKELGVTIVSEKLPHIYKKIKSLLKKDKRIIVYCWRGGMRSHSIVTVMRMMGVACEQLQGGIRSFRRKIVDDLNEFSKLSKPFVVIEGCTGTRKTDLLIKLQDKGYPVIDLEGLARHRGSIFGAVGLKPNSQKQFDCELWERLNELKEGSYYIIEGESKRIGNVVLPSFISEGKENGYHLYIEYPFQKRVEAIYQTYKPDEEHEALYRAFSHLKKYLTPVMSDDIEQAFHNKDYYKLIEVLLESYYDPKYLHKIESYNTNSETIIMNTLDEGIELIESYLSRHYDHILS